MVKFLHNEELQVQNAGSTDNPKVHKVLAAAREIPCDGQMLASCRSKLDQGAGFIKTMKLQLERCYKQWRGGCKCG